MYNRLLVTIGDASEQHEHVGFDLRLGQPAPSSRHYAAQIARHAFKDEKNTAAMRCHVVQPDNVLMLQEAERLHLAQHGRWHTFVLGQ